MTEAQKMFISNCKTAEGYPYTALAGFGLPLFWFDADDQLEAPVEIKHLPPHCIS